MVAVLKNLQIIIVGAAKHRWAGIKDHAAFR